MKANSMERGTRSTFLALACLLVTTAASANPATPAKLPPIVEQALETMERSDQEGYAYRMTKTDGDGTLVAAFDPAKPQGQTWKLLLQNGKAPTEKELETFRKERAERDKQRAEELKKSKEKAGKKGDQSLREMISPESVQLISETADRASFRFKMRADDDDAKVFADAVRGTLVISKAAPHVESLDLASTGEIKPITGVKISEFRLTLSFLPPDSQGQALPSSVHSVVKGRAMLVKKLDADATITFSDYERRAAPDPPAR